MKCMILFFTFLICILLAPRFAESQQLAANHGFLKMRYYKNCCDKISKDEFFSILSTDQESFAQWQKSKKHRKIGLISFVPFIGSAFWANHQRDNRNSTLLPNVVLTTSGVATLYYLLSGEFLREKALKGYNQRKSKESSLRIDTTPNGLGLVLSF